MFGSQFNDDPHTWLYDFRKNEWRDAKPADHAAHGQERRGADLRSVAQVVLAIVKITDGQGRDREAHARNVGLRRRRKPMDEAQSRARSPIPRATARGS